MAFELPTLPFPKDVTGTPYIASPDASGKYTVPSGQWFKNASNLWVPVSAADPLPTVDNDVKALLTSIQGYVDGLEAALGEVSASPTAYTVLSRLKDLADRLGEVSATPTANTMLARLKTLEGYLDGVEVALGTQTDAEATGDGSLIAIIKRLRTLVGQGIVTLGSAIGTTGLLMAGSDGANARAIKTASDGTVLTQLTFENASNLWVPVSAADPLPTKVQTELPAGTQIIGQVKLTDGTDALLVNANGSLNIVPVNSAGTELFSAGNPGNVQLTGSKAEVASSQDTQVVGTVQTYNRAAGTSRMEVYCESGYIRVRTDGQPCTSTTGEPIAAGFAACWDVESVSVYYIQESIITVVSR